MIRDGVAKNSIFVAKRWKELDPSSRLRTCPYLTPKNIFVSVPPPLPPPPSVSGVEFFYFF